MKDIENNSTAVFEDLTVIQSSTLNIITSNSLSLFGNTGQVRVTASSTTANYNLVLPSSIGTAGQYLATDGVGNSYWATGSGGGGGVSSVGISVPSILAVSNSPITSSGTIAITTAQTPSGTGAITLNINPTITGVVIKINSNVGINAVDFSTPSNSFNEHLFGTSFSEGEFLKMSTFKAAITTNSYTTLGSNSSYLQFNPAKFQVISPLVEILAPLSILSGSTIGGTITTPDLTASKVVGTNASKQLVSLNNTGSGDLVLKTQPTIQTPTITSTNIGGQYIGINALDSTIPSNNQYTHLFGRDTLDTRNYLEISTFSDSTFKGGSISIDTISIDLNHDITATTRSLSMNIDTNSALNIVRNDTTSVSTLELISTNVQLSSVFSHASKSSLLLTDRVGTGINARSDIQSLEAGSTGQVLTVQSGGSLAFVTPGTGGTVTSVGVSVPSILSVSGTPVTTSGTIAITTAQTPTGSGAIVLRTQPTIQTPAITSTEISGQYIGINALDPTIPDDEIYLHIFGKDEIDARNNLKLYTSNSAVSKSAVLQNGQMFIDFSNNIVTNTRSLTAFIDTNSKVELSRDDTAGTSSLKLFGNNLKLLQAFSNATKQSLLITSRVSSESDIQTLTAGDNNQVLTSDGTNLSFQSPGYTTQSTTLLVKNTIYQNTTSKPMMITLNFNVAIIGEAVIIRCDTVTPPVTKISEGQYYSNDTPVTFIVLPNYYYQVTSNNSGSIRISTTWN